jgi:hypothetical protein
MNQAHFLSNESKMAVRSKMADQIRFFDVTLRVSNIFSIFFMQSLGLSKTQILWKKVFKKIQDGGWIEKNRLSRHLGFFDNFFPQILRFINTKRMQNAKKI